MVTVEATQAQAKNFQTQSTLFQSHYFRNDWFKSKRVGPYVLLDILSSKYNLRRPDGDGAFRYDVKKENGLTFLVDPEKPQLDAGEMPVYPYFDEGAELARLADEVVHERRKKFAVVVDPFCGGGHSGLPMIGNDFAERALLGDINPRAVNLAKANAELNMVDSRTTIIQRDIRSGGLLDSDSPGNTLWIANPPFALKAKGADLAVMRDGGENGLELTMSFASQAIEKSKKGDVIVGVAYSRIGSDGQVELSTELKKLISQHGGELGIELIEGEQLWRGYNGKKEQKNPMSITPDVFALKANPEKSDEVTAYKTAAEFHNKEGYTKLGYFSYVIRK